MGKSYSLHRWHQTKVGLLIVGGIELLIAYLVILSAFDSGNLWEYLVALIFLVGALHNFAKLIGVLAHGQRTN